MEVENLKNKSTHGGKRDGAGRPDGVPNKATIEQKIIEEEFKQRVLKSMDVLINSQMNLAQGCQMLFKIHTDENNKGTKIKSKPELITCQSEIEKYLAGDYDSNSDDYYFITTSQPDNRALDSLIDRVFGKSVSKTEITGANGKDLIVNIMNYANNAANKLPAEGLSDAPVTSD